jgi:hypothetical protein
MCLFSGFFQPQDFAHGYFQLYEVTQTVHRIQMNTGFSNFDQGPVFSHTSKFSVGLLQH